MTAPLSILLVTALLTGIAGGLPTANGQSSVNLEASRIQVAYDGTERMKAFVFSPALRIDRSSISLDAGGAMSYFDGRWSAQAGVATSYFTGIFGSLQGEVEAAFDGNAQPAGPETGSATGGVRLHLLGEHRGVWLGGRMGRASDGFDWRSTMIGDIGGWLRYGSTTMVLAIAPSAVGSTRRYYDTYTTGHFEQGRFELFGSLGFRGWQRPTDEPGTTWASLSGAFWLNDHVAIVAGGGNYPEDFGRGLMSGTYVTVGVRFASNRPTTRQAIASAIGRTLPNTISTATGTFRAHPATPGHWTLDVTAPNANSVELMGDFTDWQPVAFRRAAGDRWTVMLPITTGVHRLNIRVDGGEWGVPPNLPVLTDEFSGLVSIMTVE